MPSVMMNGERRSPAINPPLAAPMSAPVPTTAAAATQELCPAVSSLAPTTELKATAAPTLRSMPPLTMIMVMPTAPRATITVWVRMMAALRPVKRVGRASSLSASNPRTKIRPSSGPAVCRWRRQDAGRGATGVAIG